MSGVAATGEAGSSMPTMNDRVSNPGAKVEVGYNVLGFGGQSAGVHGAGGEVPTAEVLSRVPRPSPSVVRSNRRTCNGRQLWRWRGGRGGTLTPLPRARSPCIPRLCDTVGEA